MTSCCRTRSFFPIATIALALLALPAFATEVAAQLPDPDGKPADMTKPVQVYILLGQSNMLGAGKINPKKGNPEGSLTHAVTDKQKYPYLVDDSGKWTERKDVRNVRLMGAKGEMKVFNNEWMTITGKSIGPEFGIGHQLGHATDAPVLILKSCIGNRSLGWDLLPPGSEGFEFEEKDKKSGELKTWTYAGYKQSPLRWEKGIEPEPIGWYAGKQYDPDLRPREPGSHKQMISRTISDWLPNKDENAPSETPNQEVWIISDQR